MRSCSTVNYSFIKNKGTNAGYNILLKRNIFKGRTFHDFHQFFLSDPTINVWQMDTIKGKKGESAILSLLFTKTSLQLHFTILHIETSEVQRIFKEIRNHLGNNLFKEPFSCILTDNGKENQDPLSIEVEEEEAIKKENARKIISTS